MGYHARFSPSHNGFESRTIYKENDMDNVIDLVLSFQEDDLWLTLLNAFILVVAIIGFILIVISFLDYWKRRE